MRLIIASASFVALALVAGCGTETEVQSRRSEFGADRGELALEAASQDVSSEPANPIEIYASNASDAVGDNENCDGIDDESSKSLGLTACNAIEVKKKCYYYIKYDFVYGSGTGNQWMNLYLIPDLATFVPQPDYKYFVHETEASICPTFNNRVSVSFTPTFHFTNAELKPVTSLPRPDLDSEVLRRLAEASR